MLLSYYVTVGRETIDIDLLVRRLNTQKSDIESIMQEICLLNLDDGFQMNFINLDDLDHQHMNYPGFRVGIAVQFGVMRDKFYVDIGVGDAVEPVLLDWPSFNYKEMPLFGDYISLEVYPAETIFAEKLETVISRGAANSRMKDYHDLLLLCREDGLLDKTRLKDNIAKTFQNRGTGFTIPVRFQSDELERMQLLWAGHLRALGTPRTQILGLPEEIDTVINELNKWLLTI